MAPEALAFLISFAAGLGTTLLAIRIAHRYRLFDYPEGWKRQAEPTPDLGGAAVILAFLVAVLILADDLATYWPVLAIAVGIGAVGMVDDRRRLSASLRVAIELGAAAVLWATDLGWSVFSSDVANLVLTCLWVVALINAMNLLDLMDGVAGTVAGVSCAGVGVLAAIESDSAVAVVALSTAGACAGFLPFNARSPARIYLGDGGSMAVGFLVAATIAELPLDGQTGWVVLAGSVALFGVPLFDLGLRVVLRRRRGIALMTGGPDSVANWLQARLHLTWKVAFALGAAQSALCVAAIAALG